MRKYDLEKAKEQYRFNKRDLYFDIYDWIIEADKELDGQVMKREVMPYSWKTTIGEMLKNSKDFDICTKSSKGILLAEIYGLVPIVNNMISLHEEPDVEVILIDGKHKGEKRTYKKSVAELCIECEMAVLA